MNFRRNTHEPWQSSCVNYQEIEFNLSQQRWTQQEFESALHSEAYKVDMFISKKQREIESRIVQTERGLSQAVTPTQFESTRDILTEILLDLNDLSKYTRNNFLILEQIIHEAGADKKLIQWLRSRSFDKQRFDNVLVKISILYDQCEKHGNNVPTQGIKEKAKYWVHPDNIKELEATLLFHMPRTKDDAVSNVYLDNKRFELYQGRLQRDEGAEAVRCGWKGTRDNREIEIERKIHQAPWNNGISTEQGLVLDSDHVNDFLSGRYSADHYAEDLKRRNMPREVIENKHRIALEIQESIYKNKLEPIMRIFCHRAIFEKPGDKGIQISLDTNLSYLPETEGQEWRRECDYPFTEESEIYSFPYAVLEIRVNTSTPEWLTRLLDSRLVYEVPRFSRYTHGIASLWDRQLAVIPWWMELVGLDLRNSKEPKGNFNDLTKSRNLRPLINGQYRMGYLETQLDRSSFLQRKSKTESNPFDDPIWNDASTPSSSSCEKGQLTLDRIQPSADCSSTDHLIRKSTQSSYLRPAKSEKIFREEIVVMEPKEESVKEEEEEKPKKKKKKKEGGATVEPKIFFANERTFIHWLHFSAIILSVALTLLNFGDSINKVVGGIFFGISFIFAIYAFGFYRWRAHRITTKPHLRFDDVFGPVFLCILLVGALVLNFALRFNSAPQNNAYLGVNGTNTDDT